MDSGNAIVDGGLTGKARFFGSSTAEVISVGVNLGGWNGDHSTVARSYAAWNIGSAPSDYVDATPGMFSIGGGTGGADDSHLASHRTILSGY